MRKRKIALALALMLTATTTNVSVSPINVLAQEETGEKESTGSVEYSTQNVLKLNEETLVRKQGTETEIDCTFTPPKTQKYVFTLNTKKNKGIGLYDSTGKAVGLGKRFTNLDGKYFCRSDVLNAGETYHAKIDCEEGEDQFSVGYYDEMWPGAKEINIDGVAYKDTIERRQKDSMYTTKLYKLTIPETGTYTISLSGLKITAIDESVASGQDVAVHLYADNGDSMWLAISGNSNHSEEVELRANLEQGKTYYLAVLNYSHNDDFSYEISQKINRPPVPVTSVEVSPKSMTLEVGERKDFSWEMKPDNATDKKEIDIISTDDSIANFFNRYDSADNNKGTIKGYRPGTCDIKVVAAGGAEGVCHVTVVKTAQAKLSATKYTYDGKQKTPSVTVTNKKGQTLTGDDYEVIYPEGRTDAGTYTVKIKYRNDYQGPETLTFTIAKATPKLKVTGSSVINAGSKVKLTVTGAKGTVGYTTSDKKIATISKGVVTGVKTGTATISVTSAETKNYNKATKTFALQVKPKATTLTSVLSKKAGELTVNWKKNTTTDCYQIQYSTSSKFTKATKVTVTSNATTTKTVKKLLKKKKYYVRIRSIDKSGKLYSSWSKTLSVKTK